MEPESKPLEQSGDPSSDQRSEKTAHYALLALSGLALLSTIALVAALKPERPEVIITSETSAYRPTSFDHLSLEAKAAYVYDAARGKMLFSLNEEAQLPLASLTKLMTAIVASESLPRDALVMIGPEALTPEGDNGLRVGERWRAGDLLDFMLLTSSNDGARALASAGSAFNETAGVLEQRQTFLKRMNEKARELNLTQTYFLNETGLDDSEVVSGGYGSAKDIAALLLYALTDAPQAVSATGYDRLTLTSADDVPHEVENTNEITDVIPGLIASKTGYTDLAGGNLVIALDAGIDRPIIISVLGSTREGRFSDVHQLIEATFKELTLAPLAP